MISIECIQKGLAEYVDTNVHTGLSGIQQLLFATATSIAISRLPVLIQNYADNDFVKAFGVVGDDGVDVDVVADALKNAIPDTGYAVRIGHVDVTMNKKDVEELVQCIKNQS